MRKLADFGGCVEDQKNACDFIKDMDFYLENYHSAMEKGLVYDCDVKMADKFYTWWKEGKYTDNPHVLIFLYEKWKQCLEKEQGELQDVFNVITEWLCEFEKVVEENF